MTDRLQKNRELRPRGETKEETLNIYVSILAYVSKKYHRKAFVFLRYIIPFSFSISLFLITDFLNFAEAVSAS